MTNQEAIEELKIDMDMIRYDPATGGEMTLEDVKRRYPSNYEAYLADEKAIAALEKIIEYEGLEEQGLLLRLPCKIGDTAYVVPSAVNYKLNRINAHDENNRVYEQTVSRIEILYTYGYALVTCNGLNCLMPEMRDETWFYTRKEAEAKLKELEGQNNGNIG